MCLLEPDRTQRFMLSPVHFIFSHFLLSTSSSSTRHSSVGHTLTRYIIQYLSQAGCNRLDYAMAPHCCGDSVECVLMKLVHAHTALHVSAFCYISLVPGALQSIMGPQRERVSGFV